MLPVSDPLRGQNARGSIDEVIDLDEVTPQQNPLLTDVIERKPHPFAGQHSQSFRTTFGTLLIGLGKYRLKIRSNEKFRTQSGFVAFYDPRHKPSAPAAVDSVEDTQGLDLRIMSS